MGTVTTLDRRASMRVVVGFSILIATSLLPGLVLSILGFTEIASITTLASISTMIPALLASLRLTALTVLGLTVGSLLALPASVNPWLAALVLGAAAAGTGLASRVGASGIVVMATISLAFLISTPPDLDVHDVSSWLVVAAASGGAALWGAGAGLLIRRKRRSVHAAQHETVPWPRVTAFTVVLTLVIAIAGWVVVELQWQHGGGWFIMTFLIVLQPYLQDAWTKTLQRATGTVVGIVVAMIIYLLLGNLTVVIYVVGAAAAVLALTVRYATKRPYWQYAALLTPAVVLLEGVSTSVTETAEARLGFTLLAAAIAILIEIAMAPLYRSSARRHQLDHY